MKKRLFINALVLCALGAVFINFQSLVSLVKATTSGWAINGDDVYFTDGKVGIGTEDPGAKLHVAHRPAGGSMSDPDLLFELVDGVGGFNYLDGASSVAISGDYVYVASDNEDSITIINISDPNNPVLESVVYDGDGEFSRLDRPYEIIVSGNYAYVLSHGDQSLTIMDISDPSDPDLVSEIYDGDGEFNNLTLPVDMDLEGNKIYIGSADQDFSIIDISDPSDPSLYYSNYGLYNPGNVVEVSDGVMFVTSGSGISIEDVSSLPLSNYSSLVNNSGGFTKLNGVRELYAEGDYLYILAGNSSAFMIVDVSNPASPVLLSEIYDGDGEFGLLDSPKDMQVYGDHVAISSSGDTAITIIDISDPSDPDLVSEFYDGDGEFSYVSWPRLFLSENYLGFTDLFGDAFTLAEIKPKLHELLYVDDSQKVGVATSNPQATLDVRGFMRLEVNNAAPASCTADTDGSIAIASNYRTCICKSGTGWVYTSDGTTSCTW